MGWYTSTPFLAALVPLAVVTLDLVWRFLRHAVSERKIHPFPPGPTPLPVVGSALSVNPLAPWLTYTKWRATHGDIIYARMLDTDIIVLNSSSVATELLEKRSRIYSDRPFIPTLASYGHGYNFGFYRYGNYWRLCRRIFQQTLRANATPTFRPMQLRKARQLICNMIDDPNEYYSHFQTFTTAVATSALYDYELSSRNDPMVSIIYNYLQAAMPGIAPERMLLLKIFPFLLHMPDWFPGSWVSREARQACVLENELVETPYRHAQERMFQQGSKEHSGTAMVSGHITRMEKLGGSYRSEYETALKRTAASAFTAAAVSTSSILTTFTLAMVENPRVWKRAQMEIDAMIGTDRLPEFHDRPSLPYVDAIMRETMRWRPVMPLIAPHATTCDDIYKGYYIPKGASIQINAWAISRDEARYPNAEKFVPERFLDKKGRLTDDDPRTFIFGFGRRRCPGRYFADASLWSMMVTMLATFDFNLAKDTDNNDITFKATFTGGFIDYPNPFPCQITPRSHFRRRWLAALLKMREGITDQETNNESMARDSEGKEKSILKATCSWEGIDQEGHWPEAWYRDRY